MSTIKASQLLKAALARISDPVRWTKGTDMTYLYVRGKRIRCFCARGAVYATRTYGAQHEAMETLVDAVPATFVAKQNCGVRTSVINYNDHPTTKHRHVVAWFKRAIKMAKRREQQQENK